MFVLLGVCLLKLKHLLCPGALEMLYHVIIRGKAIISAINICIVGEIGSDVIHTYTLSSSSY